MNQRGMLAGVFVLTSCVALLFAACGGDSSNTDGGVDATTDSTTKPDTGTDGNVGNDTGLGNDTGPGNDAGLDGSDAASDAAVPPDACASLGTAAACINCCFADYADAAAQLQGFVYQCACVTNGGACLTQCGSNLCDGGPASGQCNSCLAQGGQNSCNKVSNTACMNATSCAPLLNCIGGCP